MASVSYDTDVVLNVFRRREYLSFRELNNANRASISYFKNTTPAYASNSISISEEASGALVSNRTQTTSESFTRDGVSFIELDTDQVLVTDQILTRTDGTKNPLFFQHIINTANLPRVSSTDYTISSGYTLTEVKVLDINLDEIQTRGTSVDWDNGFVYNNLKNTTLGLSKIYYVQYTVRTATDTQTYTELLDNTNIYALATFDDLDEDLDIINDGRKVYLSNPIDNGFQIVLPTTGDYGFTVQERSKIRVLPFDRLSLEYQWFPRVAAGDFYFAGDTGQLRYYIAQLSTQNWNPEEPYKYVDTELSTYISPTLIQLNRDSIHEDSSNSLYIDVQIYDQDYNPLVAFTTNPSLHGTVTSDGARYYYWSFSTKVGIRSIDYKSGILDIEGYSLLPTYKIYSTYYYQEEDYELRAIDLNPADNEDILNQRLVLFVIPDDPDSLSDKTLYYLLVNRSDNQVIESDWSGYTAGLYLDSFKDTYTVEGSGNYLVIGEMTVGTGFDIRDIQDRDIRVAGGGIVSSQVSAAKKQNPEVTWYWDISKWDGQYYPGNASYFVEVPVSVLSGAGGAMTQRQVRDVVEKHTALGVYPIAKAYGVDPYITDVEPASTSIQIEWLSYGSDSYYNIYYSSSPDGPWTKSNVAVLSDTASGNSHTITGLTSGVVYYIMIDGGIMSDGSFLSQNGQAIGPVDKGAKDTYNFNIAKVKTL